MQDASVTITITSRGLHVGHARATQVETMNELIVVQNASEGEKRTFAEALGGLHD